MRLQVRAQFLTLAATIAGCLCSDGCNHARKEVRMEESPQMEQRSPLFVQPTQHSIEEMLMQQWNPWILRSNGANHPNFRQVVRITDARARSNTLPNHGL